MSLSVRLSNVINGLLQQSGAVILPRCGDSTRSCTLRWHTIDTSQQTNLDVFVGECGVCLGSCVAKFCKYEVNDYKTGFNLGCVSVIDQWYQSMYCDSNIEDAAMVELCRYKQLRILPYVVARYGSMLCNIDEFASARPHLGSPKLRSVYLKRGKLIFMEHVYFLHPRIATLGDLIRAAREHALRLRRLSEQQQNATLLKRKLRSSSSKICDADPYQYPAEAALGCYQFLRNPDNMRCLLWQILYACHVLSTRNIRHNDLSVYNVLLQGIDAERGFVLHRCGNLDFYVPNLGFRAKLFDFGFCSSSLFRNLKVQQNDFKDEHGIVAQHHDYYDFHYCLNGLVHQLKRGEPCALPLTPAAEEVGAQVMRFLESALPEGTRGQSNVHVQHFRLTYDAQTNAKLPTTEELLRHECFQSYLVKPSREEEVYASSYTCCEKSVLPALPKGGEIVPPKKDMCVPTSNPECILLAKAQVEAHVPRQEDIPLSNTQSQARVLSEGLKRKYDSLVDASALPAKRQRSEE